ncbi:MAG: cupin [Sphingomonadales bacterium]|nr:cupin [Sphingomonadales bacterium]
MPLEVRPVHLGLGATALTEPAFTGIDWYAAYAERHAADGAEGRLVSMHRFAESWTMWEMHPAGSEVVVCIEGSLELLQEAADGTVVRLTLGQGDYAINPPGVWHSADVAAPCAALFITAGLGTEHRPR